MPSGNDNSLHNIPKKLNFAFAKVHFRRLFDQNKTKKWVLMVRVDDLTIIFVGHFLAIIK
jgi:hypothetical protein